MNINYIINLMKLRIMNFGRVPLCNGKSSRAPFIGEFCFPLCYRCISMMASTLLFSFLCSKGIIKKYKFWTMLLCMVPLALDGVFQYAFNIESTNIRRVITGAIFGFGFGNILNYMYEYEVFNKDKEVK